jgi:transcriptional regulator with XRE-family HTH domain
MTSDLRLRSVGTVPTWTFADRIRKARREMRLSQTAFAERLGVGEKAYASWEAGASRPGKPVEIAERLEQATGWDRAWFLGWLDTPSTPPDPTPEDRSASHRATRWLIPTPRLTSGYAIPAPLADLALTG